MNQPHNPSLALLFIVLCCLGCQNKSNNVELKHVTEVKTISHNHASLIKSTSFDNYLELSEGHKSIYELTVLNDVENALDMVYWRKIFFYAKDKLTPNRIYYLQNDDDLQSFSFRGGAWVGIEKLYGTSGAFKVKSITDSTLRIDVIGDWEADILDSGYIMQVKIISDTTLCFKK